MIGSLNHGRHETEHEAESSRALLPYLSYGGGLYVRPGVLREYMGTQFLTSPGFESRFNFIAALCEAGSILQFTGPDKIAYDYHYELMRRLLTIPSLPISQIDYDVLVSASVLNRENGGSSILSKDFPFLKIWNIACKSRLIDPRKVRFFTREDFDDFRECEVR
jgi:hypothetical protein